MLLCRRPPLPVCCGQYNKSSFVFIFIHVQGGLNCDAHQPKGSFRQPLIVFFPQN